MFSLSFFKFTFAIHNLEFCIHIHLEKVQCESFPFRVWPARKRDKALFLLASKASKEQRRLISWDSMSGQRRKCLNIGLSSCHFLFLPGSLSQSETCPRPSRTAALSANSMCFCVQQQHVKKVESVWCRRSPRTSCFLKPSRSLKQTGESLCWWWGGLSEGWGGGLGCWLSLI